VASIFSARTRRVVALTLFVAAVAMSNAAASRAASPDFPAGYTAYHTYDEIVAEVDAVVAAHPDFVRKFSIGKSYEGRDLWAVKVSDNVNVDENEPEVLFDGNIHAREHITAEMTLYTLHMLADGYGKDQTITRLVNTREIYIIMMLNPDGAMWDIHDGSFHHWRKNRQPNPGSPYVGTDLNRNFGWSWGCCGGSSTNPRSIEYRGPFAWSSPEDSAYRDFVRSRVLNGVQQIKVAVSWHSFGQVILWPYGYTMVDVPSTMTLDDHKTFVALAKGAAARNGYTPKQASDLYITDGTAHDWDYHQMGVFHFTFEMGPGYNGGTFYPTADRIDALTSVNHDAVLYLIDMAACPYQAAGLQSSYCGANAPVRYVWQMRHLGSLPA
jgi:carboxypeptidase T